MRIRALSLTLICLGVLAAAGYQSLPAMGATAGDADSNVFLPLTNKDGAILSPTATSTAAPTTKPSPSPTLSPTPSPTSGPSPTPIDADLFVDDSNATGVQNGSAKNPYTKLQAAIDAAGSDDNTTIAVASGVYTENVRVQNKAIHLFGGFVGGTVATYSQGDSGNFSDHNPTVNTSHIQGDGTDSVVTIIDAFTSTLDGFRITGGTRSLEPEFGDFGGGVYVTGGSPTISHNLIENNDTRPPIPAGSDTVGGGIYAGASDVAILDNVIRKNTSGRGGGIAISGGKVLIRGNTVQENIGVSDHGGGLYIAAEHTEVNHNLIIGNEIGRKLKYGWGGGIIVYGPGSSALLSFNTVTENYAPSVGSGVFIDDGAKATLDHELIYNNVCPDGGTTGGVGLYVDGYDTIGSHVTVINTTIADHKCVTMGGNGLYVEGHSGVIVKNSIFWGNSGDDFYMDPNSQITMTYSIAQESLPGVGNLLSDPLFADATHHDYHLRSTVGRWDAKANGGNGSWVVDTKQSPGVDAGDPASAFANEPSPNGGRANLGVYGNTSEASKSEK